MNSSNPSPAGSGGIKLIIFDFDGTLVDSEPGILQSITHAVQELGLPHTAIEAWRQMIGIPLRPQLETLLSPDRLDEVDRGIELYRDHYQQVGIHQCDPFKGIPAVLDFLQPRLPLAIASSKKRESILVVLEKLGWKSWFKPIMSPTEVTCPKPHPESIQQILQHYQTDPSQAVMIGDTEYDIEMACRAGVPAWGVSWGVHPPERLWQAGATECFSDPFELLSHLRLQLS